LADEEQGPASNGGETPQPAAEGKPGAPAEAAGEAEPTGEPEPAAEEPAAQAQPPRAPAVGGRRAARRPPTRTRRWGTATAVYMVVVAAVLVAVNLVGSRLQTTWDLTANHHLTLSSASKGILAQLTTPVQIIAFLQPSDLQGTQIKDLLGQYQASSHGKLTYQVVDPAADRALAVRYNITTYGTVVVQSGTNTEQVQEADMTTYTNSGAAVFNGEGPITNAIIQAASSVQFTVDWLIGDGEPDIQQGNLPDALTALQNQGYTVNDLNLLASGAAGVPAGVSSVILVDPQQDLAPPEITALQAYASSGGHILVMLDPNTAKLPNLEALISSWGLTLQNNLVVDSAQHYGTDPTEIVPALTQAAITQPLQQAHLGVVLVGAQGLTVAKSTPGYILTPFLTSSPGTGAGGGPVSWGIGNLASLTQSSVGTYDAKQDIPGPITLGVMVMQDLSATSTSASATPASGLSAASASGLGSGGASGTPEAPEAPLGQKQFRAVVFGNAQFIASAAPGQSIGPINFQGNKDLFLNAVGWLTARQEGIAVRPNSALATQVNLTAGTQRSLSDTFLIGLPLVLFALAFSTWWARRRL